MSESVNFNLVVQINAIKTCRNLGSSHTTGERYSTWQKWNVDPTSLSDPSHSCICELDEGWGTPADDVKVPELSIPVAPKHSELQTVDWKNTKKHFIISSFTGINHHIYCSFWRKGDECTCRHFKHYIFFCHILPGIFKRWGPLFDWFFHEQFKESVQPVWVSTLWDYGEESPPILHCLTGDVL